MIRITEFLHASLLVADLAEARAFYEGVLGLEPSPNRPALGFDGVWYEIGRQQIHLLVLPNPDPVAGRPERSFLACQGGVRPGARAGPEFRTRSGEFGRRAGWNRFVASHHERSPRSPS